MITVFTPTYNRGYILHKLYESLCRQSYKDFEWLIINDGSTDNTADLVRSWQKENLLKITYVETKNGGKHRAINRGVNLASGELFFIVDSDDYLTDDALEKVAAWYEPLRGDDRFCGVSGLRINPQNEPYFIRKKFDTLDISDIKVLDYISGDRASVYRTEILKKYPFPEYDGEKFISESVVWYRMAQKYIMRYFFEGIYVCEYRTDGLTFSIRRHHRESPKGSMVLYAERYKWANTFMEKIKAGINYWRSAIDYNGKRTNELRISKSGYLLYIPGLILHYQDLKKAKRINRMGTNNNFFKDKDEI